ncbi:MAG: hypothetical protein R3268_12875, partial [Acidiferrobacterales bacterium]|nr:hypothetical protein [Acidiferrobacterales bacterium]
MVITNLAPAYRVPIETRIKVDIDPKGKVTQDFNIRIGNEYGYVLFIVDRKPVPMTTSKAVDLSLDIARRAEEIHRLQRDGEISLDTGVVLVTLGRTRIAMWSEFARQ